MGVTGPPNTLLGRVNLLTPFIVQVKAVAVEPSVKVLILPAASLSTCICRGLPIAVTDVCQGGRRAVTE